MGLIEKRIVLIDGARLAALMIEYGVGVTLARPSPSRPWIRITFWKIDHGQEQFLSFSKAPTTSSMPSPALPRTTIRMIPIPPW